MRRLFRLVSRLVALAAAGAAISKLVKGRQPSSPAGGSWDPLESPQPRTSPKLPIAEPDVVKVGNVGRPGEPPVDVNTDAPDTSDVDAPAPDRPGPQARKAAAEKLPAKKKAPAKKAAADKAPAKKAAPKKQAAAGNESAGAPGDAAPAAEDPEQR